MEYSHQMRLSRTLHRAAWPRRASDHPRGVTLVELLVTIAILVTVLALLLPGLSAARESAKRTGCMNNLAQIGKGVTGYDTTLGQMPGWRMNLLGFSDIPDPVTGEYRMVSWTIAILPYIDELDAYDWFRTYAAVAANLDDVRDKRLDRYTCPTFASQATASAALSYMGNGGTGAEVRRADGHQYRGDGAFVDSFDNLPSPPAPLIYAPLFVAPQYFASKQTLSYIGSRDGTSSTLLATERTGPAAPLGASWAHFPVAAALNANAVLTTHLILHPPALAAGTNPPPSLQIINLTEAPTIHPAADWAFRYPSSGHDKVVAAVFCDGRTQAIYQGIAPWVYCQILTSDRRTESPRAEEWEKYDPDDTDPPAPAQWVRYVLDAQDLKREQ